MSERFARWVYDQLCEGTVPDYSELADKLLEFGLAETVWESDGPAMSMSLRWVEDAEWDLP